MNFKIDALDGYFGGKGGSGTYQQIINLIPPHHTFVVPFLGHCGITRNLKPCQNWYLNDIDEKVILPWLEFYHENTDVFAPSTTLLNEDWRELIRPQMDRKSVVHYLDPTYRHEDRKSDTRYNFELSEQDHIDILTKANDFSFSNVLISTYDNELYKEHLTGWNKISFNSTTRRGIAIETLYFNFEPPEVLHDWSYMGNDFRERTAYKRKKVHLVDKFERMTPLEKNYFMDALRYHNA